MLKCIFKMLIVYSAAIQMSCVAQQYDTRGPGHACACAGGDAARNNECFFYNLLIVNF